MKQVIKNVFQEDTLSKVSELTKTPSRSISVRDEGEVFVSLITGQRIAEYSFFKEELKILV